MTTPRAALEEAKAVARIVKSEIEGALQHATKGRSLLDKEAEAGEAPALADALKKCRNLFSDIRGDWTDPRDKCREGWAVVDAALRAAGRLP